MTFMVKPTGIKRFEENAILKNIEYLQLLFLLPSKVYKHY